MPTSQDEMHKYTCNIQMNSIGKLIHIIFILGVLYICNIYICSLEMQLNRGTEIYKKKNQRKGNCIGAVNPSIISPPVSHPKYNFIVNVVCLLS